MIGCTMVEFEDVFKDCGEVEEIIPKRKLSKDTCKYIGSTLMDSYNDHVCVVLGSQKRVTCFMPLDTPSDLFGEHSS